MKVYNKDRSLEIRHVTERWGTLSGNAYKCNALEVKVDDKDPDWPIVPADEAMQWAWNVFVLACEANGVRPMDACPLCRDGWAFDDLSGILHAQKPWLRVDADSGSPVGEYLEITTDPNDAPEDCR